jgi:CHAT domain
MASPSDRRIAELVRQSIQWQKDSRDVDWFWAHPVVLSKNVQTRMVNAAALSLTGDEKEQLRQTLEIARAMLARLESPGSGAPFGSGPLELMQARLESGEINAAQALKIAADLGATGDLSAIYVSKMGQLAYQLAASHDWLNSVRFSMMLRAAIRGAGPDSELAVWHDELESDWVEIASGALWNVPDGRIYADALAAGEAVRKRARQGKDARLEGNVLHGLGTLHLDPWFANRSSETYQSEHTAWFERAREGSWDGTPDVMNIPKPLPQPQEALEKAEKYYRAAAKIRTGELRGRSLKALAQTLLWRSKLDKKERKAEIAEVIERALATLDWRKVPALFVELLSYLTKVESTQMPPAVAEILEDTPESLIRTFGKEATLDIYYYLGDCLTASTPARAVSLLKEVAPLLASASESQRTRFWQLQVRAFIADAALEQKDTPKPPDHPAARANFVRGLTDATLKRASEEGWNERRRAAEMIRLTRMTTPTDEEELGVELIEKAQQLAPITLSPWREALTHLRASLLVNCGSNAFRAKNYAEGVARYSAALTSFVELSAFQAARETLPRLADIAGDGGASGAAAALAVLAPHAISLQTWLGDEGLRGVRDVCHRAITALIAGSFDKATLVGLWQLAKGLQFGAFLTSGASQRLLRGEEEEALLRQIDELRTQAENDDSLPSAYEGAVENELILLSPYSRLRLGGRTATERMENLEYAYEEMVDRRLRTLAGGEGSAILTPEDLEEGIDPETALLDLLEVVDKSGASRLLYALWTREGVTFHQREISPQKGSHIMMDGVTVETTVLGEKVGAGRASLLEDPPAGEKLSGAAKEDLEYLGDFLLGPVWERLTELKNANGKKHLCIAPDGPLHYLPFHLLLVEGKLLAEAWAVTYVPNMRILLVNRGPQTVRRFRTPGPIAVGVGFEGTDEPLPEAVTEALDIAEEGHGSTLLNDQATEAAVQQALRNSTMVHIATHGSMPSGAAAFQRIWLSSGEGGDGIFYAYELTGQDLRGLSLVTLSACETALGRFDIGDNLRGFPANLFLAGAEAVVGTLWPVETWAASTFFRAMYRELRQSASRLTAFSTAQRETRQQHPEFRDWGAFYYSGNWI